MGYSVIGVLIILMRYLCAGIVDKARSLAEIAREEVLEETGYDVPVESLEKIITGRCVNIVKNTNTRRSSWKRRPP